MSPKVIDRGGLQESGTGTSQSREIRRIPKVTVPVTFPFIAGKKGRYFRVAFTFGQVKTVRNSKWSQTKKARITV